MSAQGRREATTVSLTSRDPSNYPRLTVLPEMVAVRTAWSGTVPVTDLQNAGAAIRLAFIAWLRG